MFKQILFLLLSLLLYSFAPEEYSFSYCLILLVLFTCSSLLALRQVTLGNFMNFHILFFVSFFFVNFVYPVFLYPIDKFYFSVFRYDFNQDLITKSTALAVIGACSYSVGTTFMLRSKTKTIVHRSPVFYKRYIGLLKSLTYISFLLFLAFVGKDFLLGIFNSANAISNYFLIAFQTLLALTIILSVFSNQDALYINDKRNFLNSIGKKFWYFILAFSLFFLFVGDRGPVLQIFFIIVGLYAIYIAPVNFRKFAFLLCLGFLAANFISNARVTRTSGFQGENSIAGFIERGLDGMEFNSFFDVGMDLIVNNRNLYVAVEHVENNGVNFGTTMYTHIIGIIPGLQSVAVKLFDLNEDKLSSARVINKDTLGEEATWGVGTNLIGDIFMSFGLVGIILFMCFFGYLHTRFQLYATNTNSLKYLIFYLIALSYAIYYPRSTYFIAFRITLWPVIILWFLNISFPPKKKYL